MQEMPVSITSILATQQFRHFGYFLQHRNFISCWQGEKLRNFGHVTKVMTPGDHKEDRKSFYALRKFQ